MNGDPEEAVDEEQDWLPEETKKKKVARRPKPDYQELAGHCESCQ